jgi:hypothetical protein
LLIFCLFAVHLSLPDLRTEIGRLLANVAEAKKKAEWGKKPMPFIEMLGWGGERTSVAAQILRKNDW